MDNNNLLLISTITSIFIIFEQYSKKKILKETDLYTILFFDTVIISIILLSFVLYKKNINELVNNYKSINNSTNIIYIIGLVFICINVVTNTQLLKDYDMNKVILYSTITRIFFTMIISVCFLKEDLTNKQKLGYFIIIIGFLLVHNK
jgi:uncharacterized membrane protein